MHIRRVEIENIRSIKHLVWELPEEQDGAGWHVILGDNGSGKTSFVRAVALAIIGPQNAIALRMNWAQWKRINEIDSHNELTQVTVCFVRHNKYDSKIIIKGKERQYIDLPFTWTTVPLIDGYGIDRIEPVIIAGDYEKDVVGHIWNNKSRYFASSFGSMRRFSGGDEGYQSVFENMPTIARHLTALAEDVDLSEIDRWLQKLKFESYEGNEKSQKVLALLLDFINHSYLFGNGLKVKDVTSRGVEVVSSDGISIPVQEMSDGYRSALALAFELVRQLIQCFGTDLVFDPDDPTKISAPGVVQIDEVDAHLHPEWQRRIGQWFKKHFPNIQFIVTTHSPLICWAADSVFVLPTPGSEETGRFLTQEELNRVKYGSIQEAYMLDAFGEISRSEEGQAKLKRLTELNNKEWDGGLTEADKQELQELRAALPLSALRMKV